ncbi:hypothetical protein NEMIN01_2186 [Nematocida minor]|uniref:uncharacterized protein n=1 Tax=Nematocida minor TaxID=1912983 RepID=UPI00221FD57F|nr:uncharacterized protein NEMIN01_2186 [Nematocida minor]KAI5192741.1 hypothetical protein NEMIN01_2186 [Nematocida minor]
MKPSQIFATARRKNRLKILNIRNRISDVLALIPLSAIAKEILSLYARDQSAAVACTSLLYVAYIIFIRASSITSEYDTGNSCKIAIYYILSKWTLLGAISLVAYTPYSLIFIVNMIVPDNLYFYTLALFPMGYITYLVSMFTVHILLLYPVCIFALSFFHFLLSFQEMPHKKTQKMLIFSIYAVNVLFTIHLSVLWALILYYCMDNGRTKKMIRIT